MRFIRQGYLYSSLLVLAAFISPAADAISSSSWHTTLLTGGGYSRNGEAQNLWLSITPEPGLENNYSSGGQQRGAFFLGLATEKTMRANYGWQGNLGFEFDYLRNHAVRGVVMPMVNVAPDFDTLMYSYEMNSYLVMATGKIKKVNLLSRLGGYFQAGGGMAVNDLYNYDESSPRNSTAAPMLLPFGNQLTSSVAYMLGVGISYPASDMSEVSVGYRYYNVGHARLATTPVQQTNNTLHFSPVTYQFLVFAISVS